jgi:hypothetical protein
VVVPVIRIVHPPVIPVAFMFLVFLTANHGLGIRQR